VVCKGRASGDCSFNDCAPDEGIYLQGIIVKIEAPKLEETLRRVLREEMRMAS
jgi:hypothetical protein